MGREKRSKFANDAKTTADIASQLAQLATMVTSFGAKGDGVTDDTLAIKNALASGKRVHFPKGSYRTTSPIVFEQHIITADSGATILKDHSGVGAFLVGGSLYTEVSNLNITGHNIGASTGGTIDENQSGFVIIGNRVKINRVQSFNHKGNGFYFIAKTTTDSPFSSLVPSYLCNMNKSILHDLYAMSNDGYGYRFAGNQDDMSVWELLIYAQYNILTGIRFDDDCMARNMTGYLYSEGDGRRNTTLDHSVYFGKVRFSQFHVYAEGQQNLNASEIYTSENSSNLGVITHRNNRDINKSTTTKIFTPDGYEILKNIGITGNQIESVTFPVEDMKLSGLSNKTNWFADLDYKTTSDFKRFTRAFGAGGFTDYILGTDGVGQKTILTKNAQTKTVFGGTAEVSNKRANGTIDVPTDVIVGDVLHRQIIEGFKDGSMRNGGKIEYVVSYVSTGKISCDIVFYTVEHGYNTYKEAYRIKADGSVVFPKLAGAGVRPLSVDSTGTLIV
jgi:hypothetical protein